jgi:hypothetical protein
VGVDAESVVLWVPTTLSAAQAQIGRPTPRRCEGGSEAADKAALTSHQPQIQPDFTIQGG